ncbi:hypothetical protein ACEN9F_23205 [Duganella sp. CT11-25]|uniref:hypothetical protein n=1 Tax=unclassified Duganella TaxID=2636909 RepID=UPI0039B02C13
MYNVIEMKDELNDAMLIARSRIKTQFVTAFKKFYQNNQSPAATALPAPRIDVVALTTLQDLKGIFRGEGFYVIFTDRPVANNTCELWAGDLQAVYRGECSTTRKRITSHLFNAKYKEEYAVRKERYESAQKNTGRDFYEPFWAHCIKLDEGSPGGINLEQEPYNNYKWLVAVHRMEDSSQQVRELAELAFDEAFGHPAASRDR